MVTKNISWCSTKGGFSALGTQHHLCFWPCISSPDKWRITSSSYVFMSLEGFAACLELCGLKFLCCFPQELHKGWCCTSELFLRGRCFLIKCFKLRLSKYLAASSLEPWAVTRWFQVAGQPGNAVNLENISIFPPNYSHVFINSDIWITLVFCASSVSLKCQGFFLKKFDFPSNEKTAYVPF